MIEALIWFLPWLTEAWLVVGKFSKNRNNKYSIIQ